MYKYLNNVSLLDDWFQYEYIYAVVNKKLDAIKGQLARYEMEKYTKHYTESINHNLVNAVQPEWIFLQRVTWYRRDALAVVEKMIWETFLPRLFLERRKPPPPL